MAKSVHKENVFPPEWDDDQRMTVLFAAFRDKSLNPHSWNQKMNFWMSLICDKCKQTGSCTVDITNLALVFERKGKNPKCLDLVIQEMIRLKKLKNINDIECSNNEGWMSWGFNVIKKPISWSFSLLAGNKSTNTQQLLYLPDLVKAKCEELLKRHYSSVDHDRPITDNIVEIQQLRCKYQPLFATDVDLDVCLRQLEADGKIVICQIDKDTVIKFCKSDDKRVKPIEECQMNVYRIMKVGKDLEKQLESLYERCESHTNEAKQLVKERKKKMALQSLRKRKAVERVIDKKSNSLDILDTMLLKIQEAATNEMVVRAYEAGVSALKSTSKNVSLEEVENVMDNLQDVLEDQEEVNQTLMGGEITVGDTTIADLENELDSMLDEEKNKCDLDELSALMSNLKTQDVELPDVPIFSPGEKTKGGNSKLVADS